MTAVTTAGSGQTDTETERAHPHAKPWPRYEQAAQGLRNYWYPALLSGQLKHKPTDVKMLGEELVFIRREGRVHCLEGRCKHRGVPLSEGRFVFPCTISCAYHGWTYDLASGRLVAALTDGPDSAMVGKVRLRTYPVVERQGVVWAFIGDGPPPPLEEDVPKEFLIPRAFVGAWVRVFPGNWRIAMEGALDPSHAFFMHRFARLNTLSRMPAYRGRYWPEIIDGRYLGYRTDVPTPQAEYPGLGRWPREAWWKRSSGRKTVVTGWLPCGAQVTGIPTNAPFDTFSWYVPVDRDHYRWFQFLITEASGPKKWWAGLKYWLWLRWMYQGEFLGQDSRINRVMHAFYAEQDGWSRERLYRPDVVVTAWRKFVDQTARGIQE